MKIMSVDFGDTRTGIAVCDPTELLTRPVCTIEEKKFAQCVDKIVNIARELSPEIVVVGLPINMDGSEGFRATKCKKLAKWLTNILSDIEVTMWDERCTTIAAADILSDNNVYGKKRKDILDAVSAQVILESFLESRKK